MLDINKKAEIKLWTGYRESKYEAPADGYDRLRAEVVRRAINDYARALRRHRLFPYDRRAQDAIEECEMFFREEMGLYIDADGEGVIEAVQEKVRREKPKEEKTGRGRPRKDESY